MSARDTAIGALRLEDQVSIDVPYESGMNWHVVAPTIEAELNEFSRRARDTLDIGNINQDVEWLAVSHNWPKNELLILATEHGKRVTGVATFKRGTTRLDAMVGPVKLLSWETPQFQIHRGPVLSPGDRSGVGDCFANLCARMEARAVVFAGDVLVGSDMHAEISDPKSRTNQRFLVLPWGDEEPHCGIRWEGSVEAYLKSISRNTARDLKRRHKRLFGDPTLEFKLKCFQAAEEVKSFISDAMIVSKKTWQQKEHGIGISFGGDAERTIQFAARAGNFLGYVLYQQGNPVAFDYCLIVGKTCVMKQKGYDPAIASLHPGTAMLQEMLYDFERKRLPVHYLDFMPLNNVFKLRTSNDKPLARNYYLFKRSVPGYCQYTVLLVAEALTRLGKRVSALTRKAEEPKVQETRNESEDRSD